MDADTGEEVSSDDIMKGHKVDTDSCSEFTKDELENIALDRTIDIDEVCNYPRSQSNLGDLLAVEPDEFRRYPDDSVEIGWLQRGIRTRDFLSQIGQSDTIRGNPRDASG